MDITQDVFNIFDHDENFKKMEWKIVPIRNAANEISHFRAIPVCTATVLNKTIDAPPSAFRSAF